MQLTPPVFASRRSSQRHCHAHANSNSFFLPDNGVSLQTQPSLRLSQQTCGSNPPRPFNNTSPNPSANLIFLLVESILLFVSSEYSLREKAAHLHGLFAIVSGIVVCLLRLIGQKLHCYDVDCFGAPDWLILRTVHSNLSLFIGQPLTHHRITAEEFLFLHRNVNQIKNLKSVFVAYDVATPLF